MKNKKKKKIQLLSRQKTMLCGNFFNCVLPDVIYRLFVFGLNSIEFGMMIKWSRQMDTAEILSSVQISTDRSLFAFVNKYQCNLIKNIQCILNVICFPIMSTRENWFFSLLQTNYDPKTRAGSCV